MLVLQEVLDLLDGHFLAGCDVDGVEHLRGNSVPDLLVDLVPV